ncbi:MAG: hypothetical protein HQL34_11855 [Alphaproteobacteria bacterium]|nr:hypothetical protein [Alphaproteobacteria bacterium]
MRRITYFHGGMILDFDIEDARYDDFTARLKPELRHSDAELGKAQGALGAYVAGDEDRAPGPREMAAACYVWDFFHTHPDASKRIDGVVVIVDLAGNGETIEYAAESDLNFAQDSH